MFPKYSKTQFSGFWENISIDLGISITKKLSVFLKNNKESLLPPKKVTNLQLIAIKSKSPDTVLFFTN